MIDETCKIEKVLPQIFRLDRDTVYDVKIEKHKEKRSLNANSYCWLLIGEIANTIGKTKEDVYRDYISNKGIYRIITMNSEAVPTFVKLWSDKGLGWLCELSENKIMGLTDVIAYYGTSSYNTKQMSNFINYVVQEARNLGIKTKEDYEIERLIEKWNQ